MDYKQVFFGILVAFAIGTAFTAWANNLNSKYASLGGQTLDTGFMQDVELNSIEDYAGGMAVDVGESTETPGVSSDTSTLTQSKSTFSLIRGLIDFVPRLLRNAANYLGVPEIYARLGTWAFIFAFGLTLAYLLLLGVKKLIT